jgi:hypothetical protein
MNTKTPECYTTDTQARCLRVEMTTTRLLVLPLDQFVFAELDGDGKEQKLRLVFATHEVLISGHALRRIETAIYGYAVLLSTVLQKIFGLGLDPTFGIGHVARERSTPLAYDLMEPFRPCVDWRVIQWMKQQRAKEIQPGQNSDGTEGIYEVTKEYRKWVTGFPLVRADYLDLTLEIQGVIEGVVRGFRRAVVENQPRHYKPWTPRNTKWAGSS